MNNIKRIRFVLLALLALTALAIHAKPKDTKGKHVFNAVVAQDGSGDYSSVQEAINAAPEARKDPWLIFVKRGVYSEHVDIPENKPFLCLIGEGRGKTQISCNRLCGGPTGVKVDIGATVTARSSNLYFEGIDIINSYGHEQKDGPQALALYTMGDRVSLRHCGLLSFQDTWLTAYHKPNLRHYSTECFIEGAVDFIYGQGNVLFDHDTLYITRKQSGYIVAPNHHPDTQWGYVFLNNIITAPGDAIETQVYLGRPWHSQPKVAFINTRSYVSIYESGWRNHMGGLPSVFAEYNTMDGYGHALDLSRRCSRYWVLNEQKDTIWCTSKAVITADEAALYTIENVLSGDDNWQPLQIVTPCDAPVVGTIGRNLTWQPIAGSIGYLIEIDGKDTDFTTDCQYAYNRKHTYRVRSVNRYGALSK